MVEKFNNCFYRRKLIAKDKTLLATLCSVITLIVVIIFLALEMKFFFLKDAGNDKCDKNNQNVEEFQKEFNQLNKNENEKPSELNRVENVESKAKSIKNEKILETPTIEFSVITPLTIRNSTVHELLGVNGAVVKKKKIGN
ncbi:hypothetical protein NUSPORA_01005 [Nucleospora cyclopteri]